jgi:hypothetical protein
MWVSKYDGSLRNGKEYVLEPAVKYNDLKPHVKAFADAFDPIKIGLTTRGGFHVHVQAHDYSHDDAFNLAKLYTYFQPAIDSLLGESRANNRFCTPFESGFTKQQLIEEFELNREAPSREQAKYARRYRVINFAMMRCTNPQHRSIEFRQGSPSKRFANIYGWSTFVTALTDMARNNAVMILADNLEPNIGGLVALVKEWQLYHESAQRLDKWIKWRYKIMNDQPTSEDVDRVLGLLRDESCGLFSIATRLDINYPMAKKALKKLMEGGLVEQSGNKYRICVDPNEVALNDLELLKQAAISRGN